MCPIIIANIRRYRSFSEIAVLRAHSTDAVDRINGAAKFPRVLSPIINVLANILRASRLEIPRRLLTRGCRSDQTLYEWRSGEQSRLPVQDAKRSKDEIRVDDCCP